MRIEKILFSYNILMELYVMINKLSIILYLHALKYLQWNIKDSLDILAGIDEQSITTLVFISVE